MPHVYLVDSSIYIFRAWFSMPDSLVDRQGQPINAVMGFYDFAIRLLSEIQSKNIVFVFDESLEYSHRNEIYPPYKQNRDPAPEELKRQFQHCRDLISSLGICAIGHNRYEADDVIGTLVHRVRETGQTAVVVSADKDLAQLIRNQDIWWHYAKGNRLDYAGITEYFGVSPTQIPDWLALSGDPVDNIPGVPGIGTVTATKLLQHFGTLDKLLDNLHEVEFIQGLRRAKYIAGAISEHIETVRLARKLTGIYHQVPLADDFTFELAGPDHERFAELGEAFGFGARRKALFKETVRCLYAE